MFCDACTGEFRGRLAAGQSLDDMRIEAFAVVREASLRVLGMRHYDCQLVSHCLVLLCATQVTSHLRSLLALLPWVSPFPLGFIGSRVGCLSCGQRIGNLDPESET